MRAWAVFFARVILGLIFGMAGYWKCFVLTPTGHAVKYFLPFADTWIPIWLLWPARPDSRWKVQGPIPRRNAPTVAEARAARHEQERSGDG